jgi:hypothetical protein
MYKSSGTILPSNPADKQLSVNIYRMLLRYSTLQFSIARKSYSINGIRSRVNE